MCCAARRCAFLLRWGQWVGSMPTRSPHAAHFSIAWPRWIASPRLDAYCGAFFALVVVIITTLTRTNSVPRMVRRPRVSPPRKYPTSTATTGFT